MRETLVKFDKETTPEIKTVASPVKEEPKRPYYLNKRNQKSNNSAAEMEKFNKLIKVRLNFFLFAFD